MMNMPHAQASLMTIVQSQVSGATKNKSKNK